MSSGTREDFTDPPDPEPCSCDQALALEKERDTFRDMARQRGDLLVSEVERRLAAERACTATTERLYAQARTMIAAESRLAEANALLRWIDRLGGMGLRVHGEIDRFLSAAPAQAAEPATLDGMLAQRWEQAAEAADEQLDAAHERIGVLLVLLGRIVKYAREDRATTPGFARLSRALAEAEKLLSAAPAQAATGAELAELFGFQSHEPALLRTYEQPAQAAEPVNKWDPDLPHVGCEHPDTIALRECRAELEQAVKRSQHNHDCSMRDSKRAWDAEQALESARAERDTALARITVLESRGQGVSSAEMALHRKIAQAVAALRKLTVMNSQDAGQVVDASSVEDIASDLEGLK